MERLVGWLAVSILLIALALAQPALAWLASIAGGVAVYVLANLSDRRKARIKQQQ